LIYSTNGRDIRLNVAKLRSGVADAYWFNPRTGVLGARFATIATGPGAAVATFNPPGSAGTTTTGR
jgi:Putative collagen-binding domain of a collagenase